VTEELDVLKLVAARLDAANFPYMLTGSMAANYYAVPRMTRDIDLVVELSVSDTDRLCALFEDFYLDPDAVRAAIAGRTSFNAIHTTSVVKVDFMVRKDSQYRHEELRRRRRVALDETTISVVAPEDSSSPSSTGRVTRDRPCNSPMSEICWSRSPTSTRLTWPGGSLTSGSTPSIVR